jgi:hypothetical protein
MHPYHLQKQLFAHIIAQEKSKSKWVQKYMQLAPCSKSIAYDRIEGKRPITLDEGIHLIETYGLPGEWPHNLLAAPTACPLPPTLPLNASPEESLTVLYRDLQLLAQSPQPQSRVVSRQCPLFWLKYSRLLTSFKMYCWFNYHQLRTGHPMEPFDAHWKDQSRPAALLDQCKNILRVYQTIPGIEIWSLTFFEATIAQMHDVLETDGMPQSMFNALTEELLNIIDTLEQMAARGTKDPAGQTRELQVFTSKSYIGSDMTIGYSDQAHCFLHLDMGFPRFMRQHTPNEVNAQLEYFRTIQSYAVPLSMNTRNSKSFFNALRLTVQG